MSNKSNWLRSPWIKRKQTKICVEYCGCAWCESKRFGHMMRVLRGLMHAAWIGIVGITIWTVYLVVRSSP